MKIVKLAKEYARLRLNWFCFFEVAKRPNKKMWIGNMKHLGEWSAQIVLCLPTGGRILRKEVAMNNAPKMGFMQQFGELRSIVEDQCFRKHLWHTTHNGYVLDRACKLKNMYVKAISSLENFPLSPAQESVRRSPYLIWLLDHVLKLKDYLCVMAHTEDGNILTAHCG